MKLDDLTQIVRENLFAQRLRALLTIVGIAIGIAAVIAVMAIGQGGRAAILSEIETLGSDRYFEVTVNTSQGEAPTVGTFSLEDANLIKELSPAVEKMAPVSCGRLVDLKAPQSLQKPLLSTLLGTTPDFAPAGKPDAGKRPFPVDGGCLLPCPGSGAGRRPGQDAVRGR